MSTLAIKAAPLSAGAPGKPHKCDVPACPRSPSRAAEILGWPIGRLCQGHAREWRAAWDAALAPQEAEAAA